MATFCPSTKPASFKPCRNAVTRFVASAADVTRKKPTTGMDVCWARATRGQVAAALPRSVINSRRLIASPETNDRTSYRQKLALWKGALMSALGHKPTYAVQNVMSDLPPIATAKAEFRKSPCLLQPRKQIYAVH